MGNQNSRLERRLGSTASQDPRLTTTASAPSSSSGSMNDWLPPSQDPYQRQYPLPIVSSSRTSSGRLKLRKHSSPLIPTTTAHRSRRPLSRAFLSSFKPTPPPLPTTMPPPPPELPTLHPLVTTCPQDPIEMKTHPPQPQKEISVHLAPSSSPSVTWIDGRKFHTYAGSTYLLPCDEEEIDRLHLLHFMVRFAIQGNYLAPVTDSLRKGAHVLDIGCGPGSWTMEIAGEYPKSTIIGVDLNNVFPRDIKPINCQFYQCDALQGFPFEDDTFDYVFMRFMGQGIGVTQWDPLMQAILRILKPGGWVEVVEVDLELHRTGPITKLYNDRLLTLMTDRHLDPHGGRRLKERFEARDDLMNINTTFISCPGGQWAGKLGQLTMQSWKSYYRAIQPQICLTSTITPEEYNENLDRCWDEANEYKTFENVHFAYAQKRSLPLNADG